MKAGSGPDTPIRSSFFTVSVPEDEFWKTSNNEAAPEKGEYKKVDGDMSEGDFEHWSENLTFAKCDA